MKIDFSKVPRVKMWQALIAEEEPLKSRKLASASNTEPNDERIYIPKELYGDWNSCPVDPFPDFKGIVEYAQTAGVWEALQREIDDEDYASVVTTAASGAPLAMPFAMVTISGMTSCASNLQ